MGLHTIHATWKQQIRDDLAPYKDFPGKPLKSLTYFDRMIDLGMLPINSQEGVIEGSRRPADLPLWRELECNASAYKKLGGRMLPATSGPEYTERAYLVAFVPRRLAPMLWYHLNLTDKVCLVDDYHIPVTYGSCFEPGRVPAVPKTLPYPTTRVEAGVKMSDMRGALHRLQRTVGEPYVLVQMFDPTHGRPARKHLYPDVLRCLRLSST
jgi:hypothetical protein